VYDTTKTAGTSAGYAKQARIGGSSRTANGGGDVWIDEAAYD
jgi:hypothetical protein